MLFFWFRRDSRLKDNTGFYQALNAGKEVIPLFIFDSDILDSLANVGNWQWAAGTGADAQPYFRIFNPDNQVKKFDKEKAYIKRLIPEIGTSDYTSPMVDHAMARNRAIAAYKKAIALAEG